MGPTPAGQPSGSGPVAGGPFQPTSPEAVSGAEYRTRGRVHAARLPEALDPVAYIVDQILILGIGVLPQLHEGPAVPPR